MNFRVMGVADGQQVMVYSGVTRCRWRGPDLELCVDPLASWVSNRDVELRAICWRVPWQGAFVDAVAPVARRLVCSGDRVTLTFDGVPVVTVGGGG